MDELWEEPKDLARRDLFYGPWGKELAPNPTASYTFASAKSKGVSPGFTVMDEQGTEWSVKQGAEAQVEVVSPGCCQPSAITSRRCTTCRDGPSVAAAPRTISLKVDSARSTTPC